MSAGTAMQVRCSETDREWFDSQAESMGLPDHGLCRESWIVLKGNKRGDKARPTRREDICIDFPCSLSHLLTKRWAREAIKV